MCDDTLDPDELEAVDPMMVEAMRGLRQQRVHKAEQAADIARRAAFAEAFPEDPEFAHAAFRAGNSIAQARDAHYKLLKGELAAAHTKLDLMIRRLRARERQLAQVPPHTP